MVQGNKNKKRVAVKVLENKENRKKNRHTFGKGVLGAVVLIGAVVVLVGDFGAVCGFELELSTSLVLQQENKKQPMAKEWNWFVCVSLSLSLSVYVGACVCWSECRLFVVLFLILAVEDSNLHDRIKRC